MARSPKDDPRYNDNMKHNTWNYCADENCAPGTINERSQPPISVNSNMIPNNNMYGNTNFSDDVYLKNPFNVPTDASVNLDDKSNQFNNVVRPTQNYGNAMLKLGNGQLVPVFYDENNKHLIFPMSGQYELFNHNQGVLDSPLQPFQPSGIYTPNQDYTPNNNVHMPPTSVTQNGAFQDLHPKQPPSSNFLNDLLGNLEPTTTGTYSPFGQNYPLNHPDISLGLTNSFTGVGYVPTPSTK